MRTNRTNEILGAVVTLCCLVFSSPARAEVSGGVRTGFSSGPDQTLVGGQLEMDPVDSRLYIVPSAELGLGDHLTSMSFDGDLQYRFPSQSKVAFYAGGGLSMYVANPDGPAGGDTNLGVGALGGMSFNRRSSTPMFVELKAGLSDEVPDWKANFGVSFR